MGLRVVPSASEVFYNDSLAAPALGTNTTQGAIDVLKAGAIPTAPSGINAVCGVIAGIFAGQPVAVTNSGGLPRAVLAGANGGAPINNCIGIASAFAVFGNPIVILTNGEVSIPDAYWTTVPATADVGSVVFLSETTGLVTLTAPTTPGAAIQQLGTVNQGGAGSVKIAIFPIMDVFI